MAPAKLAKVTPGSSAFLVTSEFTGLAAIPTTSQDWPCRNAFAQVSDYSGVRNSAIPPGFLWVITNHKMSLMAVKLKPNEPLAGYPIIYLIRYWLWWPCSSMGQNSKKQREHTV